MYDIRTKCGWCEQEFALQSKWQLIAFNCGRNVYCSLGCRNAFDRRRETTTKRYTLGPCPHCGNMFHSRIKDKIFCSIKCYVASDRIRDHLAAVNPTVRLPVTNCLQCGAEIKNRHAIRKFCSKECRRRHYAERFDRWVANPDTLALPQCYDEFLMQEELPCLIDGCEWVGKHLSSHVNFVHGIKAEDLKKLAGFNRTTGLVPPDVREAMSERMKNQIESGITTPGANLEVFMASRIKTHGPATLEAKEHLTKAQALVRAAGTDRPDTLCPICGNIVKQDVSGLRIYCSSKCRAVEYARRGHEELICTYCNSKFEGKRNQVLRVLRGQKVCCSANCRNQMNMIACMTARGISNTDAPSQ